MQKLDTGKLTLNIEEDRYISAVIYTNDELARDDIEPVTDYLNQFSEPVPAIIQRTGHYSISVAVQITLMQQTKHRLRAVAFVERDHRDVLMTRIASSTYFKDIEVKSFYSKQDAAEWLKQRYATRPILTREY